jgi:hypothetical protein
MRKSNSRSKLMNQCGNKGVRNYKPAAPLLDERSATQTKQPFGSPGLPAPVANARLRRTAKPLMGGNRSREPLRFRF